MVFSCKLFTGKVTSYFLQSSNRSIFRDITSTAQKCSKIACNGVALIFSGFCTALKSFYLQLVILNVTLIMQYMLHSFQNWFGFLCSPPGSDFMVVCMETLHISKTQKIKWYFVLPGIFLSKKAHGDFICSSK